MNYFLLCYYHLLFVNGANNWFLNMQCQVFMSLLFLINTIIRFPSNIINTNFRSLTDQLCEE